MRVALCLSGQPRFVIESFDSIRATFLESNCDIDIFFHFWNTEDPVRGMLPYESVDLYIPKKFIIEPQRHFVENLPSNIVGYEENKDGSKFQRVASMYYSMKVAHELALSYSKENNFKYDCMIRSRTDIYFDRPFSPDEFLSDPSSLWVHHMHESAGGMACNDQFAFGSEGNMSYYSACFDSLETLIRQNNFLFAEALLYKYLVGNDELSFKFTDMRIGILRNSDESRSNFIRS